MGSALANIKHVIVLMFENRSFDHLLGAMPGVDGVFDTNGNLKPNLYNTMNPLEKAGYGNVAAYIMVSMALYGGALIAAAGGASVATERALGWSRQLRLTPLNPTVYIAMKAMVALVMGAVAITVVNVVALIQGRGALRR